MSVDVATAFYAVSWKDYRRLADERDALLADLQRLEAAAANYRTEVLPTGDADEMAAAQELDAALAAVRKETPDA